jgi:hypothetical protein
VRRDGRTGVWNRPKMLCVWQLSAQARQLLRVLTAPCESCHRVPTIPVPRVWVVLCCL